MATKTLDWIKQLVDMLRNPKDDDETYDLLVAARKDFGKLNNQDKDDVLIFLLGQAVRK